MDLGKTLERFLDFLFEVFGGTNIHETFQVEGLASMIRATRGRSIDR